MAVRAIVRHACGRGETVDTIGLGPIDRKILGVQVPPSALKHMTSQIARKEDGTIILTITIPAGKIKTALEEVMVDVVKNAELPGFRKGMAPRKTVEEKVDKFKIQEDVLRKLLPETYLEAIKEHKLQPIMSPKVHVEKIEEGKDWEFTATTCELPEVKLNDYKKAIKSATAKSKIAVPGKENTGPNMDDIVKTLLDTVKVTVPQILLDNEVERLLAQLLDEVKSLGLSLDQYLTSTHKTIEQIRAEYATRATSDVTFEFALQKIADEEKISVDPKEIQEALAKAKDDQERKNLEANMYLLANILRQQKTLDFLKSL